MIQGDPGLPTEKTQRNIKAARSHSLYVGPYHLEWKLWTGNCLFFPRWQGMMTEFFNEGPVYWFRCYWLTMGFSWYRLCEERRTPETPYRDIAGLEEFERRGR